MIVAGSASPLLLASAAGGYNLTRSLRFRSSASAYLNRTPASAGNRQVFTWSAWVKLGNVVNTQVLYAGRIDDDNRDNFYFSSRTLRFQHRVSATDKVINTVAVYRDPSAWYHVVFSVDTTQATDTNRVKIYVNGVQQTLTGTYPLQNANTTYNNNSAQRINVSSTLDAYFDGYLTEINSIDGQALTPSSFGENNEDTGVWQPKKYAGTYGTNGFYLPFSDNASTTTLGNDFSGNGNNWTTNNISLTAGSTYDSMTDVPTLTSATAANFCTLNPLIPITTTTFTNGNLGLNAYNPTSSVFGTIGVSSGKWYFESVAQRDAISGISGTLNGGAFPGAPANGYAWDSANAEKYNNGVGAAYGSATSNGDIIGVAFDLDAGTITFYKNNVSQGVAYTFSPSGSYFPAFRNGDPAGVPPGSNISVNFGQQPFAYTPPTGFVALNTFNLPTPTIGATASTQANKYFDATLYTGNSSTQTITNAGGFSPDFVWIKGRSDAWGSALTDVLRGVTSRLTTNNTAAEVTTSTGVTSLNSNGFSLDINGDVNNFLDSYVAWQWDAGGTGVTNTAGSITSTVSANTSAGFSVVTYTGTGANATIGHGLGVAPKMVIVKVRSTTNNWTVYHANANASPANGCMFLDLTSSFGTGATLWNNTMPTSTVFNVGSASETNSSGATYVAYCFSEVAGYSKFGSFTGNFSSDGPFVYTGFRPAYVMFKNASSSENWFVMDATRSPSNIVNLELYPNLSNAEGTDSKFDMLSNGFKIRSATSTINGSGNTIIYMAFAQNPFKYSLAR